MDDFQLIATVAAGLEACVKRELVGLGFADAKVYSPGRVIFRAGPAGLVRANLWLRTAERVLLVVGSFEARDFGELFDGVHSLNWHRWIDPAGKFPVTGRSHKSQLSSVPACQKIVKKAIADKLISAHRAGDLPETGATYAVEVAIRDDRALLTIDTSGAGLHKRGYRAAAGPAPLKETLAAAMVQLSFWKSDRQLIDPFCGSGTIPIEAAMIGRNIAPGIARLFAAEQWEAIEGRLWQDGRTEARDLMKPSLPLRIIGTDIEPKAISLSAHHADLASVADDIHFQQMAFDKLVSSHRYGCVIGNPPYGRRFDSGADIMAVYRSMPEVFRRLKTWSFYVITNLDLEQIVGQQADRRRKLYNGPIECTYYQFYGPKARPGPVAPEPSRLRKKPQDRPGDASVSAFGGLTDNAGAQAEAFANRLKKSARHMRRWPGRGITCYRLYDRDIPEVPLAVDVYEGRLHIAEYERPSDRTPAQQADWLDMLAETAGQVMDVQRDSIFLKRRSRQRGTSQYGKFSATGAVFTVGEGQLTFEVNLSDYLDTGLFLDHRITRDMVRKASPHKRMLNLFAYTGAFSVYSAAGGAASTATVDLSNTYLDWARRNMRANGFDGPAHKFLRTGTMEFLSGHEPGEHYDLAVIDPPTFSASKQARDVFDVQRHHVQLLTATAGLMPAGGVIYFSTNFRRFKLDADSLARLAILEISRQTVPEDFRNKRIHRCWRMTVK